MSWCRRRSRTGARSGRAATRSSSKPNRCTTSSSNRFCSSSGNAPCGRLDAALDAGDELHERRLVLLQVVEERPHLGRRHAALEVVEQRRRTARRSRRRSSRCTGGAARGSRAAPAGTPLKSLFSRASTQTGSASDAARDISARSSAGTLRAFSQSRRVTRIRLASNESYSCSSSNGGELVEQPPDLGRRELLVRDATRASRAARRARARRAAASSSAGPTPGARPPRRGR